MMLRMHDARMLTEASTWEFIKRQRFYPLPYKESSDEIN